MFCNTYLHLLQLQLFVCRLSYADYILHEFLSCPLPPLSVNLLYGCMTLDASLKVTGRFVFDIHVVQ